MNSSNTMTKTLTMNNDNEQQTTAIPYRRILILFIISRIILFASAAYIQDQYPAPGAPPAGSAMWRGCEQEQNALLEPWRRWDALWFINVARDGYRYESGRQSNVTIFPLYPMTLRLVAAVVRNHVAAGLIVSNLCLLLLSFVLYRLVAGRMGSGAAFAALLFLYAWPSSFILSAVYSESMFLLFAAGAFYYADRRRWALAGAAAALASATRLVGFFLLPALCVEFAVSIYRSRNDADNAMSGKNIAAGVAGLAIAPLGGLAHFFFLYHLTGDFTAYFEAQKYWGHDLTSPFFALAYQLGMPQNFSTMLEIGTALVFISFSVIALYRFSLSQGLYSLAVVLAAMSATTLYGLPRYVLAAYPVFAVMGAAFRHPAVKYAAAAALCAAQFYCLYQFITWRLSF